MAHCKSEDIKDLKLVLEEIRSWDKIQEKGEGKFYFKSKSFLHFHLKDERRWADIRDGLKWGSEVDIPFSSTKKQITTFLKEAKKRYQKTLSV